MWKWIGGIGLLIVLVVSGTCWYGLRKMSSLGRGDAPTTTMIAASPERVFASLADGDSIPDWMISGIVRPSRHGVLRPGDTLHVSQRDTVPGGRRMAWVVTEVAHPTVLALRLVPDTFAFVVLTRRHELQARGDSTALVTTVLSPVVDSLTRARQDDGRSGGAVLGFTTRLMLGAMRMQTQLELSQLKARIEGQPTVLPPRP